jgi:hypothetical protein
MNPDWLLIIVIVAGFRSSERLVRRIGESLSADVENQSCRQSFGPQ